MATTATEIQALYVAYFNRPADVLGLQFWLDRANQPGKSADTVANEFSNSKEYRDLYANKTSGEIVDAIYMNLFGRHAETAGLVYWALKLDKGELNIGNVARIISTSAQNEDKIAIDSKVDAASQFTASLTDAAEILGYSGDAANAVAKTWLAGVKDADTLAAATTDAALDAVSAQAVAAHDGVVNVPKNLVLTAGVDNLVGGVANDTITGTYDPVTGLHGLSGLDTIDGGAGVDTLTLSDAKTGGGSIDFTLATAKNVEVLKVTSVGTIVGNTAANSLNLKTFAAGLTDATVSVKQGAALTVTAATTTNLSVSNNHGITIVGAGGNVAATSSVTTQAIVIGDATAAAGQANKITSATVTGGSTVSVTDNSGADGIVGATLTTVSVSGNSSTIGLKGDAITNVTLVDTVAAATLTNTKAHTLNLSVDGVGTAAEIIDDTATAINLTVVGASDLIVDAGKAAALTVAAADDLTLVAAGSDYAALTKVTVTGAGAVTANLSTAAELVSIDASGSTGGIDVTIAGTNSAAGGAAAQSVTGGSGDDTVTITGALGTGSTLSLGDGSDSVKISGAGAIGAGAVVDAGAGDDVLSLTIVGGANVGAFKNFEQFDVAGFSGAFDQAVLNTKNTVTNFVGTGATTAATTLQNLGAGVGFIVKGDMDILAANVVTLTQATAGALTISTDVDGAEGDGIIDIDSSFVASNAKTLVVNFGNDNVDVVANKATVVLSGAAATALTIDSNGSNVTNTLNYTDTGTTKMAAITVTGDQALVLGFATGTALASVDASGQTAGGLTFDLADLTASGTIKLGAGDDVLNATGITTTAVTSAAVQTLSGFEKGAEEGLSAQKDFDVIKFAGAAQAANVTAAIGVDHSITDGLYTFIGAGAANLAAAVAQIAGDLAANETVVFDFAGSYYVYGAGATTAQTDDLLVKLTGVTSVKGLDIAAATEVYVF